MKMLVNFVTKNSVWKIRDIIVENVINLYANNVQVINVNYPKKMTPPIEFATFVTLNYQIINLNRTKRQSLKHKKNKWKCIWIPCNILMNKKIMKSRKMKKRKKNCRISYRKNWRRRKIWKKMSRKLKIE